jgi:hypothetical protein
LLLTHNTKLTTDVTTITTTNIIANTTTNGCKWTSGVALELVQVSKEVRAALARFLDVLCTELRCKVCLVQDFFVSGAGEGMGGGEGQA